MAGSGTGAPRPGRTRAAAVLAALLALAACVPADPYRAPAFPFAAGWREARGGAPVLMDNAAWWRGFGDPLLDRLVETALQDSPTLAAARARVAAAEAARGAVEDPLSLRGTATVERAGVRGAGVATSREASLGMTWLFDPWGRLRSARLAALARAGAAEAERDAAQLLLIDRMARAYAELRLRQRLLDLGRTEAASRGQTLAITRTLLASGAATRLEITRAEARIAENRAELPELQAAVTARLHEIAVLAGAAPGALPDEIARALAAAAPQPRPRLSPEVGIPADLLRNRPDIRLAERGYLAALADLGAARAALYPSLSLGGTITAAGGGGRRSDYALGPTLSLPALPGGPARAAVAAREAAVAEAHAVWTATVIQALGDVETALADYRAASRALQAAARAAALYGEALELTRSLARSGGATVADLIEAERDRGAAQEALADVTHRRALGFIALNVRLGAGHATAPGAPPGDG
jgi:multidrug efflux system outer membrane protein